MLPGVLLPERLELKYMLEIQFVDRSDLKQKAKLNGYREITGTVIP